MCQDLKLLAIGFQIIEGVKICIMPKSSLNCGSTSLRQNKIKQSATFVPKDVERQERFKLDLEEMTHSPTTICLSKPSKC